MRGEWWEVSVVYSRQATTFLSNVRFTWAFIFRKDHCQPLARFGRVGGSLNLWRRTLPTCLTPSASLCLGFKWPLLLHACGTGTSFLGFVGIPGQNRICARLYSSGQLLQRVASRNAATHHAYGRKTTRILRDRDLDFEWQIRRHSLRNESIWWR